MSGKLSPAELLAELDSAGKSTNSPAAAADAIFDSLDFSDLSENSEAGEQTDPETQAPTEQPGDHEPLTLEQIEANTGIPAHGARKPRQSLLTPEAVKKDSHLSELFDRVSDLLETDSAPGEEFTPKAPATLDEAHLTSEDVERLVLKYLLNKGAGSGRQICAQICLPYPVVDPILRDLKQEQVITHKGAAEMGDYVFTITDRGRERARRYQDECTYFGSAPVSLADYLRSTAAQSIAKQEATEADLQRAFEDLIIAPEMMNRLGPAVNSGRGMFLFGEPGNGKTSIAERITRCFGTSIWIPRALGIDGDIIRVFDPGVHELVEEPTQQEGPLDLSGTDRRWVRVERPTVIAGGELTMAELEVTQNTQTGICEGPLQLKSNCGTLVIDDFGRQTMPVDVLLNRWIVPLEKRYDFLNLPSGKKIQVPFDQLIIFSTNLEPRDLVDGAFLRRIPYKIEVPDPTENQFRELCQIMAPLCGFEYHEESIQYLIDTHYTDADRRFKACHPRDLLQQVRNFCTYRKVEKKLSPEAFDFAVENYFSVM